MSRKTIGICISGHNRESDYKIVEGIYEQCQKYDCNLLIFSSFMPKDEVANSAQDMTNVIRGEAEIFNLINYDKIDGLIIFGSSFVSYESFENIVISCRENDIPFVDVGDLIHSVEHNVFIQNKASMELIVEHLVTVHGFTKINYIGGIPDNKESEERLDAYKNVLTRHNIPIEPDRISYGYFWKQSEECVKEFLKAPELPEAIVCANDTMAIFAMDYLKNCGYSIPDDIVVTGFDGTADADLYSPSITTIRPDYYSAGLKTFELMYKLIQKEPCNDFHIEADLCLQESCGCKKIDKGNKVVVHNYMYENYGSRHDVLYFSSNLSKMNLIFAKAENSYTLFNGLMVGIEALFLKKVFICICSELEREKDVFYNENPDLQEYGISKNMTSVIRVGHDVPVGTVFQSKDYLPLDFLHDEKPCLMFFSPMYFKDRFLGYTAFEPQDLDFAADLFLVWLQVASNDIGSFYVKNELENMYVRDPLTGLYNRRGMKKMFSKIYTEAIDSKKGYITVFCADIDYLKAINDYYGHEAGDNAIVRVADAIKMSLPKNSICVRTGGDEYCMLSVFKTKPDVDVYIKDIKKYLDTYNEKSKVPYKVMCSCGYCTKSVTEVPDITKMLRIADEELYKVKANRETEKQIIQKYED